MIPILYEKDEIAFISNGLCRLRDCISCEVTEERNGIYECDFTYPIDGANFDYIIPGRIVGVTHDDTGDIQPFDIVGYTRPIDGIVTFHCVHISYRLKEYAVGETTFDNLLSNVLNFLSNATGHKFNISADFESTGYMSSGDGIPKSIRQYLGGVEGSVLDTFGGEYEWDKFKVTLHKSRGQVRDFTIRYGVNMMDFTDDTDYEGTFNNVYIYWAKDGIIRGSKVGAGLQTYSGRNVMVPLDVTDKFEFEPSVQQLQAYAKSYLETNKPNLPKQNIKVEFVRLQDSPEYAQYSGLLQCSLCDSIKVIFPDYSTDAYFKIVRTVWDVLEGRFIEMELGDLATTLAEALGINETTATNTEEILTLSSIVVETESFSDTFTANTYTSVTSDFTKTGYYPLGIVGYSLTGTNSSYLSFSRCYLSARDVGECTVLLRARNATNADSTPTINVDILWVKAGQSPNVMIYQDIDTKVLYMR